MILGDSYHPLCLRRCGSLSTWGLWLSRFSLTAHFFLVRAKRASIVTIPARGKVQTDRSRFKSWTFYEAEGRIIGAAIMRYSHKGDQWEQIRSNCKRSAFFTRWQTWHGPIPRCVSRVCTHVHKSAVCSRVFSSLPSFGDIIYQIRLAQDSQSAVSIWFAFFAHWSVFAGVHDPSQSERRGLQMADLWLAHVCLWECVSAVSRQTRLGISRDFWGWSSFSRISFCSFFFFSFMAHFLSLFWFFFIIFIYILNTTLQKNWILNSKRADVESHGLHSSKLRAIIKNSKTNKLLNYAKWLLLSVGVFSVDLQPSPNLSTLPSNLVING